MIQLAIFASGSGTNAVNIFQYFSQTNEIGVALILTDNPTAGIIEKARQLSIPVEIVDKATRTSTEIVELLDSYAIDFIVLAGYLKLIPPVLIKAYPNKIVNIHPALLPNYGGKGMYGMHVHQAVINNKATHSGITIHVVNEQYDKGKILVQKAFSLSEINTSEELANEIHQYEYQYFPVTIEAYLKTLLPEFHNSL